MIIRTPCRCRTCGQGHVVRIGMGQEEYQTHRFPCRECGEEMVIGLRVDYETISCGPEEVDNVELVSEEPDFLVINVNANFVIPEELRHADVPFVHLPMMKEHVARAMSAGSLVTREPDDFNVPYRPYRRPDIENEWVKLKKAWSLARRGKNDLCSRIVREAGLEFYSNDPPDSLRDWVWSFALFFTGTAYEPKLTAALDLVAPALRDGRLDALLTDRYAKVC